MTASSTLAPSFARRERISSTPSWSLATTKDSPSRSTLGQDAHVEGSLGNVDAEVDLSFLVGVLVIVFLPHLRVGPALLIRACSEGEHWPRQPFGLLRN